MNREKPFILQFVIVGGALIFLYIFFALATSIYRDYKLDLNIQSFSDEINKLAALADEKPKDVQYYESDQYKDRYAKESLNLLDPGEKVIIIPQEEQVVKSEVVADTRDNTEVLKLPIRNQWWEYYFGNTLSLEAPAPDEQSADQTDSGKTSAPADQNKSDDKGDAKG